MEQLSEGTLNIIKNFITIRILLVVVLIFTVYWYLFPKAIEFFANPRSEPVRDPMQKTAIQS